jgi:hypothetical protein
MNVAFVFAFLLAATAPLAAAGNSWIDSSTGKLDTYKMGKDMDSIADGGEYILPLFAGIMSVSAGACLIALPLLAMDDADPGLKIGLAAGGVGLTVLGIWILSDTFPKMNSASIPGFPDTKLSYSPVYMQSSNSLAHCMQVSSAF